MKGKLVCVAMLMLALVLGCRESPVVNDHEHERKVLELANRHAEQQSLQSRQMAELQKHLVLTHIFGSLRSSHGWRGGVCRGRARG